MNREGWRGDPKWRRLAMNHYRAYRLSQHDVMSRYGKIRSGRRPALNHAIAIIGPLWARMVADSADRPFDPRIDSRDLDWAVAQWAKRKGSPVAFTLSSLKKLAYRDDRGRIKIRSVAEPKGRKAVTERSDHADIIRDLLAWIDGRSHDPGIVARAARVVGLQAVHAAAE